MTLERFAFALLVAGEAIFLALTVVGGFHYPGYDHLRQYISELGATGAVTGPMVSWWGFLPSGGLIMAFCLMAAWLMRHRPVVVAAMLMLAFYAYGLINSAVYPCDFECAGAMPSPSQTLHNLITGTGYMAGVVGVFVAAFWLRAGEDKRLATLGLVCGAIAFAGLVGMALDVELRGLLQRGLEAAIGVFLLAFGYALSQRRLGR